MRISGNSRAFTLVELMAAICIVFVLVFALVVYVPQLIDWARKESDHQTYAVLNDALTRYKEGGGDLNALTLGAPVGRILTKLQTAVTWSGGVGNRGIAHQFLVTGYTYPARSLQATGTGAQYQFYQVGAYSSASPPSDAPTTQMPYGPGVLYLACASIYYINIGTSTGYWAWASSDGTIHGPIAQAPDQTIPAGNPNVTIWACSLGSTNKSGNITNISTETSTHVRTELTAINAKGLTSLNYIDCAGGHLLHEIDVGGLTNLRSCYCFQNPITSYNFKGCNSLQLLSLNADNITGTLDLSGFLNLKTLDLGGNALTSVNIVGDNLLPAPSTDGSTSFKINSGVTVIGP